MGNETAECTLGLFLGGPLFAIDQWISREDGFAEVKLIVGLSSTGTFGCKDRNSDLAKNKQAPQV